MFRSFILPIPWMLVSVSLSPAIEPFELPDAQQRTIAVVSPSDAASSLTVVCFLGTECPLAKLYAPRLNALSREFSQVRFFAINSNRQDSIEDVQEYEKEHDFLFPVLKDYRNVIADRFQAKRTPEVFVLDGQFQIRYRGRIDDQYLPGLSKQAAEKHELRKAIEQLLAGQEVTVAETEAVGCLIGRVREPVRNSEVNYCDQISRLLQKNCVECHREGEIGPFALDDYEEVVGWADMMLEVVMEQRMPPWHANPEHGDFENARTMPEHDKTLLRQWVESGMPYGNPDQLPEPLPHTDGWRLPRQPDQVVAMSKREFVIPADGTVEYQYFVVDPGFTEDKWVTGAQIVPGNPRVVHHSIVFVRPPDGARPRGIGWLTAYVPGTRAGSFPPGYAIHVPAKSKLVFQQHYTPTGTEQRDLTTLGITFGSNEQITHEVYTLVGIDQQFEIPPHAANHVVHNKVNYLPPHATLRAIMPHMHLRGKSFQLTVLRDGAESIVLDVPRYDFNWQHAYRLKDPISLSTLDELRFQVAFDNSRENPVNPNPDEFVTWGDQTWEEMAVAFFEVSEPREQPAVQDDRGSTEVDGDLAGSAASRHQAFIQSQIDRILGRFDKNKDGVVEYEEATLVFRRHGFREFDENGDRRITRSEIETAALRRVD